MWLVNQMALVAAAAFAVLLICPSAVLAHAEPTFTEPTSGLQLTEPPQRVALYFDEPVDGVYLRVFDGRRERIDEGGARIEPGVEYDDPLQGVSYEALYATDLGDLGAGAYTVDYCVRGDDGHAVGGSFEFRVLGANAEASTAASGQTETPGGHDHSEDECDRSSGYKENATGGDRSGEAPSTARVMAFGGLGFAAVVAALATMLVLRRRSQG